MLKFHPMSARDVHVAAAGALLLIASLGANVANAAAQEAPAAAVRPGVQALVIDERVDLDGHLSEEFWQRTVAGAGFVQRQPDPGEPATERTEVRLAYDADNLYIGVTAFDSDPAAIVAREMRRDGEGAGGGFGGGSGAYRNDDSIAIVLDTFLDGRNAFYFETNPTGARADALVEDEGNANFEWDGVWRAAAKITEQGWSAELIIPFSTLRFDPEAESWGLNVRRLIRRKSEESYWAPVGLDANLFRLSLAGKASGMQGLVPGINLRVKPYAVGGTVKDYVTPERSPGTESDFGLDLLRWGITDSMTLDVTVNTDFAQVEVDAQQVNLTRFSLFFPEKREFFLENAGIFDFGPASGGRRGPPLLKMFHSRRIGIGEAGIVPINAGVRLTGRAGDWSFGLLDAQTGSADFGEDGQERSTNWGVTRVKRNLGERSSIGAIFSNKQLDGDNWNRVVGLDADINPSRRLNFNGFIAGSRDGGVSGTGLAGGVGGAWRGRVWRATASVQDIRDDFNTEFGFQLRTGIRRYDYSVDFEPRPDNNIGVRNLSFQHRGTITTLTDGTLESVDTAVRFFGFDLRSGDRVTFFGSHNFERLFEPFEISDGIVLDPGDYNFADIGIFVRTDGGRPVSYIGFYTKGNFWNGTRLQGTNTLTLKMGRFFSTQTSWNFNNVDLPGGSFKTNLLQQRFNVALSPELFWNTLVQLNDADYLVTINSRFNWIYKPGADLFLVYNQSWGTGDGTTPLNRAVVVKFTYLFTI